MTTDQPKPARQVVTRIARYSTLRSAERALLPSVRRRSELPGILHGRPLISRLQELLDAATKAETGAGNPGAGVLGTASGGEDPATPTALDGLANELEAFDAGLDRIAAELRNLAARTPLAELRATLPATTREHASETLALLDLHLEELTLGAEPPFLVDYMITLLASSESSGVRTLRADPCSVSPGVKTLCARAEARRDDRSSEFAEAFRAASLEVLTLDHLEPLILRVRGNKSRLGTCFFDRDVLRCLVNYNLAVSNRFHDLLNDERSQDVEVLRTLAALRALDERPELEMSASSAG